MEEAQDCLSGLLITSSKREVLLFSIPLICFSYSVTTSKINIFLLSFQEKENTYVKYLFLHCFLWFSVVLNLREKANISYHLATDVLSEISSFASASGPIYLKGFCEKPWNSERLSHSIIFKYVHLFISITSHFNTHCETFISVIFRISTTAVLKG